MKKENINPPFSNTYIKKASLFENVVKNRSESELRVKDIYFIKKLYSNKI